MMNVTNRHPIRLHLRPAAAVVSLAFASPGWAAAPAPDALPTGGNVTAGSATISQSGNRMDVRQTSQRAIVEWQSFDVGRDAHVNFDQPNASAVTLNRVLAGEASQIFGKLTANGQLFIVNPSGVVFGAGSRVDVGGLVASSLDIKDDDFLAGRHVFAGTGGRVINQGTITAADGGYVALLAPEVRNEGVIVAKLGSVAFGAGKKLALDFDGTGLLSLAVEEGAVNALAENRHLVQADGGQVLMSAKAADELAGGVINNSGTIRARTLENRNGVIKLIGDMERGRVELAGTLDASAPDSGNGGFVETSAAKVSIAPDAHVTTAAANGKTGTWLIDPNDYTIGTGGDITGTQLGSNLGSNNVTILSSQGGTAGNGDIFVNDAVSWTSANTLTLSAVRNIAVNQNLASTGGGSVVLRADSAGSGTGAVSFGAGKTVSLTGGSGGKTVDIYYNPNAYTTPTDYSGNVAAGTLTAWMLVNDVNQLQAMNTNLSGNYALGKNIDASATAGWNPNGSGGYYGFVPVGNNVTKFTGAFDGLGHAIDGLTVNRPGDTYVGLFGMSQGVVRNVGMTSCDITGDWIIGGLIGENHTGTISNVYVTGRVRSNAGRHAGGLVGANDPLGTVSNSYSTATVNGYLFVGGLVGSNSGTVSSAYSTGAVSGSGLVGGLVGYTSGGTISNSYAIGSATGSGGGTTGVGGLVGYNSGGGTVSKSYATGAVSGPHASDGVGGLVGFNANGSIANNSFWNTETSGQPTSAGGTGLTTAQMMTGANFTSATAANGNVNPNWDFANIWRIVEGQSYPALRALVQPLTVTTNATTTYAGTGWAGAGAAFSYSIPGTGSLVFGTPTYGGSAAGAVNAGSYTISTSNLASAQFDLSYANGTLTINKAPLTVTASNASKTYDGNAYSGGSGVAYSGFVNGETAAALGGTLAYGGNSQGATNAGSYTITPSGLTSGNYTITFSNGTLTVSKAPLTVTANDASKTYDGNAYAGGNSVAYSGFVNGETTAALGGTLTFGGNAQGAINAGSYALAPSGLTSGNYSLTYVNGALTIGKKTVTATPTAANKSYDGTTAATITGYGFAGLVGTETLGGTETSATFDTKDAANGKTVTVTGIALTDGANGGLASNYSLASTTATTTADIAKASLTVTANAASKTYDGNAYSGGNGVSYSGFVNGETATVLGGTLAYGGTSQGATTVGTYTITPSGLTSGNYSLSYSNGSLSISARPATDTSVSESRTKASSVAGAVVRLNQPAASSIASGAPPQLPNIPASGQVSLMALPFIEANAGFLALPGER
ncbi:MAG: YDG domain-containing protein [Sterolibacteriaceae bacterium MAG5]|nr:YDG domain-containing protein [Candidatus Nitricoxidireducens bremensis]